MTKTTSNVDAIKHEALSAARQKARMARSTLLKMNQKMHSIQKKIKNSEEDDAKSFEDVVQKVVVIQILGLSLY